jgi:hypothetical protein
MNFAAPGINSFCGPAVVFHSIIVVSLTCTAEGKDNKAKGKNMVFYFLLLNSFLQYKGATQEFLIHIRLPGTKRI